MKIFNTKDGAFSRQHAEESGVYPLFGCFHCSVGLYYLPEHAIHLANVFLSLNCAVCFALDFRIDSVLREEIQASEAIYSATPQQNTLSLKGSVSVSFLEQV